MSEQKKYIGKKRPKIFTIEKNYPQQKPKNSSKRKINTYTIQPLIPSEEIPIQTSQKIYLNLDESNDKINTETQKHSLIGISKLVFEYLKSNEYTTGNEVTEYIKNRLQSKKNDQLNQKNIQRRVYDAINVMCAVGLIQKNKQKIQFLLKTNQDNKINKLNEEINSKEKKKSYLTLKFYEKYTKLNKENKDRENEQNIEFPFDIIEYDNSSPIKITSKEDSTRYLLLSNSGFVHLTPYDIIKKLISHDISLKINENPNNIIDCKSNSKKSTNDNSLVEEFNYNINNNDGNNAELEDKKSEVTPKKYKLFSESYPRFKYLNSKEQHSKKTKEEKEDELIFDYLKNKKIFLDELESTNDPHVEMINNDNNDMDKSREEQENNYEKESENIIFTGNRFRKNSNLSYCSNFYDENLIKRNKCDLMSDIEMFI